MEDIEKKKDQRLRRRGDRQPRVYRPQPFAAIYGVLLIGASVGAFGLYFLLLHIMHAASATLTNKIDVAKTALLVVGGSGALAGLYVSYRKQRTDEATHVRDQDKLFTERYTQAAAQLGSAAAAVRLAGVYALARIADDSERDRPTCLEVLCAYLRMPYDPDTAEPAERQVRTTAQTAIGKRLHPHHPGFWAGAEVDLSGAYLLIYLRFEGIRVSNLIASGATFSGGAGFGGARFDEGARFDGATFSGDVGFGGARFNEGARFDGATFSGNAGFGGARFDEGARFDGATFSRDVGFEKTTFSRYVGFGEAVFDEGAQFGRATFSGGAGFGKTVFGGYARFHEATFSGGAQFDEATFQEGAGFGKATFSGGARFDGATFSRYVGFAGATFQEGAGFGKATFSGGARFDGAMFQEGAGFGKATFSGGAGFDGATFNRAHPPVWPDGFVEPAGIVWNPTNPPAPTLDPDRPADPADPTTVP